MGLYDKFQVGGEFVSKNDPYKDDWAQDLYLELRDLHNGVAAAIVRKPTVAYSPQCDPRGSRSSQEQAGAPWHDAPHIPLDVPPGTA